jgi:thiosulfate reductase cytochrome b subunit
MDSRSQLGFMLIILGALIVLGGIAVMFADKIPYLGRLPGDITIHGKNWSFHFPIVTGLILSIVLTLILNLLFRR